MFIITVIVVVVINVVFSNNDNNVVVVVVIIVINLVVQEQTWLLIYPYFSWDFCPDIVMKEELNCTPSSGGRQCVTY